MRRRTLSIIAVSLVAALVGLLSLSLVTAQPSGPSATRSFNHPESVAPGENVVVAPGENVVVAPGENVVVTITYADAGLLGVITENLPPGFRYVSSNVPTDNIRVTGQVVTGQMVLFALFEVESPFTYTVTASRTAGSHSFSGVVRDSDQMENHVGGDSTVEVQSDLPTPMPTPTAVTQLPALGAASATRSFNPESVAPGENVVVTITHADAGSARRDHGELAPRVQVCFPAMFPPIISGLPARWSPARWSSSPCLRWNLLSRIPLPLLGPRVP